MNKKLFFCFVALVAISILITNDYVILHNAHALGTWNGQDTYQVPMSWCIVQGSPAEDDPDIDGDTTTDAVIWRRHERPTDNIYLPQSGISFRSAINNVWTGSLHFPIIADTDTTLGAQGDVHHPGLNFASEFLALIQNCDTEWSNLGRAGIGITAVNINLFHDDSGDYVFLQGWAGCDRVFTAGRWTNDCAVPYTGRMMVVDNKYLHPSSPDRTFPGSGAHWTLTQPFDWITGHELGHTLGLVHRNLDSDALMIDTVQDNDGDGIADSHDLNNNEVDIIRTNALIVGGMMIDPPNQLIPGDFVSTLHVDQINEIPSLEAYLDLSSVKVTLNKKDNEIIISQQVFGIIPQHAKGLEFWSLIDSDYNLIGADFAVLQNLGLFYSNFDGSDYVVRSEINEWVPSAEVWRIVNGQSIPVLVKDVKLTALVLQPSNHDILISSNSDLSTAVSMEKGIPVQHSIHIFLDNSMPQISLGIPFTVQTVVLNQTNNLLLDKLDDSEIEKGVEFVLEDSSFPVCFPQKDVAPGDTAIVDFEGFPPNSSLHALLGPKFISTAQSDIDGKGIVTMLIPTDTKPGPHLITIGIDDSALTADCIIGINGQETSNGIDFEDLWWLYLIIIIIIAIIVYTIRRR